MKTTINVTKVQFQSGLLTVENYKLGTISATFVTSKFQVSEDRD